ncbi:hypothetical protein BV372_20895, partial [Nostoc sp. T09]|uniref:hypothetical protein n=1 Tax=Nostoc sp. T09 TaxID=1932621 RepID=UPI000B75A83C
RALQLPFRALQLPFRALQLLFRTLLMVVRFCSGVFNADFCQIGKGTGLRLAIARQIAEETHDGRISCHSLLGENT